MRRWTLFWLASNRAEDEQNNVHSSRPFTSGISAERKELLTLAEKENRAKRRKPLSEAGYAQLETAMPEYSYLEDPQLATSRIGIAVLMTYRISLPLRTEGFCNRRPSGCVDSGQNPVVSVPHNHDLDPADWRNIEDIRRFEAAQCSAHGQVENYHFHEPPPP